MSFGFFQCSTFRHERATQVENRRTAVAQIKNYSQRKLVYSNVMARIVNIEILELGN